MGLRQSVNEFRSSEGVGADAMAAGAVGLVCLIGAFLSFVFQWGLETYLFLGFLAVIAYGWVTHQALTAKAVTFVMTATTVVILGLIIVFLFMEMQVAWQLMGTKLFIGMPEPVRVFGVTVLPGVQGGDVWNPGAPPVFSLVPAMWATILTTVLAIAVAGPLGIATALFIGEIASERVRDFVKPGVEILAGIPSIVYGFIGFTVLNEYVFTHFEQSSNGSLFLAGIVIGVMALPTVTSVAEDAIDSVPESMKSGSLAVGTTDWQTMTSITLPAAFSGVSAAVLLGVGRALGETMAAAIILRGVVRLPEPLYNLFDGPVTLTAMIATQYGDATSTQMSALFAAGVVLFVTVLIISIISQYVEARVERKLGGKA